VAVSVHHLDYITGWSKGKKKAVYKCASCKTLDIGIGAQLAFFAGEGHLR
jgi:hypothetical protein